MDTVARTPSPKEPLDAIFAGSGRMAARMRAHDWAVTPLGPVSTWPQSLKTTVRIMLTSRYAMWMAWGPELTFFCNDAYRPTLGVKDAWALGESARRVWEEIWPDIGPRIEKVLSTGEATWDEGLQLFLERSGYPEETYHTFSYSPLAADDGAISGMLCVVTEETERVIGERRLSLLRDVGTALASVQTEDELFATLAGCVQTNARDLPFTLAYLFEGDGAGARLAMATGVAVGEGIAALRIDGPESAAPWPLHALRADPGPIVMERLRDQGFTLPSGPWDRSPAQAVLFPIAQQGQERAAGFLVAGVNPYRPFDAEYRGFMGLLIGQIAASLASVRAYEKERRRTEALAELDRAKTTFFSNVSHEFRTPLTLMLGPLEEAIASPEDEVAPRIREMLTVAHRNGRRLMKLVNTLLDFTRIEAGRVQARYEPTDLAAATAELASVFRSAIEKAGLRLVVDCASLPEPVFVDHEMWEKIVLNLLSNAFKFTLEGEIAVALRASDGRAILEVRDTGTGIAADQLPHIFERFHRVEGTRARTHEGTGIGLALVQELARLHGGVVSVESAPDVGTTFTVSLPLGRVHLPPERIVTTARAGASPLRVDAFVEEALHWLPDHDRAPAEGPVLAQEAVADTTVAAPGAAGAEGPSVPHIVLADDNADMRGYVLRLLQPYYRVTAVSNGEEALRAAAQAPPDLILSDVMMPLLDGFGLIQALRSDPATASVPVILLSARAGEEARIEGLAAGADDYLTKPFSARELLARVSAHLELARGRREADRALRESEARLQALFEAAPLGIYLVDEALRIRAMNPIARAVFGEPTDPVGRSFAELIYRLRSPESADAVLGLFRHTLETGEPYVAPEWTEAHPHDGDSGVFEWQLNQVPLPGGRRGVVCYFREITAQVRARVAIAQLEAQHRRAAEGLRTIAARVRCLLWYAEVEEEGTSNLRWRIRMADEEAARRFLPIEIAPGNTYGMALADSRLPEDRVRLVFGDEETRAGRSYRQEYRVRDAHGSVRWLAEDVQIETVAPGRWYAVGICVDITDAKRAEEERERHLAEIETLNNRLQRAMTETHHRVKNNLQLISALIDMQRHTGAPSVPMSELERLSGNVRALAVIHDILTTEAKAGHEQETLSVHAVLSKLLAGMAETAGDRTLTWSLDDVRLVGRQTTTLALVTNELVSNALKHGRGRIEVAFRVEGDRATLTVCDDGPGFPRHFDAKTAANTGLELVENIVRWDLQGSTDYRNRVEGGAQISVHFTMVTEKPHSSTDP